MESVIIRLGDIIKTGEKEYIVVKGAVQNQEDVPMITYTKLSDRTHFAIEGWDFLDRFEQKDNPWELWIKGPSEPFVIDWEEDQ